MSARSNRIAYGLTLLVLAVLPGASGQRRHGPAAEAERCRHRQRPACLAPRPLRLAPRRSAVRSA